MYHTVPNKKSPILETISEHETSTEISKGTKRERTSSKITLPFYSHLFEALSALIRDPSAITSSSAIDRPMAFAEDKGKDIPAIVCAGLAQIFEVC